MIDDGETPLKVPGAGTVERTERVERDTMNYTSMVARQARLEKAIDDLVASVHRDLEVTIRTETQLTNLISRVDRLESVNIRLNAMEAALAVIEASASSQRWIVQILSPTIAAILSAIFTYLLLGHRP